MVNCIQQINWQLEKADLEAMLQQAGSNYTALEFKMCIDGNGNTHYYMSLVGGTPTQSAKADYDAKTAAAPEAESTSTGVQALQKRVCPVPPGCNNDN